ncbi:hypothetical protein MF628_08755 [Paenibacillus polymyxa]|uniref:hypothetical protein n=1 Tax=Paenibacillus polymyxa TaxID=1406 RepID=UPI0020241B77|nr:hypothetical protein [Paenibacillus polymyxa]WDZ63526.1 hypothetical protein MF628_08755 [Paenibacillus polymyxa]
MSKKDKKEIQTLIYRFGCLACQGAGIAHIYRFLYSLVQSTPEASKWYYRDWKSIEEDKAIRIFATPRFKVRPDSKLLSRTPRSLQCSRLFLLS